MPYASLCKSHTFKYNANGQTLQNLILFSSTFKSMALLIFVPWLIIPVHVSPILHYWKTIVSLGPTEKRSYPYKQYQKFALIKQVFLTIASTSTMSYPNHIISNSIHPMAHTQSGPTHGVLPNYIMPRVIFFVVQIYYGCKRSDERSAQC